LPLGFYRAAYFECEEQVEKHEFVEEDYPDGDGPDFKLYFERKIQPT
jgi:hypothetical protein